MSLLSVGCCLGPPLRWSSRRRQHCPPGMHRDPPDYWWRGRTLNEQGIEQLSLGELTRVQGTARVGYGGQSYGHIDQR